MVPVEDLLGVPYRLGARLPGPATDCFGLVVECCRRAGRPIPDPFVSADEPTDVKRWIAERLGGWRRCEAAVPGGVVEFRSGEVVGHIGYLLNEVEFLHSLRTAGAVISRVDRAPWRDRIVGFYAYE